MATELLGHLEVWLVTGSQELYGPATLRQVEAHAREVAAGLDAQPEIPVRVVHKEVAASPGSIRRLALEANAADTCVGVIAWMHTFSPAKMWIAGLARAAEAAAASPHAVQPRAAVGGDRHGLHEPEPVGARRPRVRVHGDADGAAPEDGRRALERPGRRRARRRVGARGLRLARGCSGSRSRASATTCARSRSPRATRSRRSCGWGSR